MKRLFLTPFLMLFLLNNIQAQEKQFLKSDFSLTGSQGTEDALYYRMLSDNNPNSYIIYDLMDGAVGREEIDRSQGFDNRKLMLVYPDLTPKEVHLLEERKMRVTRNSIYYHENGTIKKKELWDNGLQQQGINYDEEGKIISEDKIILAGPRGGLDAWNQYVKKTLTYPVYARRAGAQGTIFIEFDVNEKGEASNFEAIRTENLHPDLIKEALRVVKSYQKGWEPYSINGKATSTKKRLPIRFVLS